MVDNKEMVQTQEQEMKNWESVFEEDTVVAPLVDIYETDEEFYMVANMPGISKDNVKIKLEDNTLVLMGKNNIQDLENRRYILNEMPIGHYYRRFNIAESIDLTKIEAHYENGQLIVKLPKHERVKPKTIEIK